MKRHKTIIQLFICACTTSLFTIFITNQFNNNPEFIASIQESVNHGISLIVPSEVIKYQNISECGCTRKFLWPPQDDYWSGSYNSSCSDEGTFYATGQKVVTFSMHFPNKKDKSRVKLYKEGIQLNLQRMREYYPGYSMRIYTDEPLVGDYCKYICNNSDLFWCDIRKTPSLGNQSEMFMATWRFLVLGDPTVDVFLSRDLDSAIIPREAAVVRDWLEIEDKKAFHLMRDKHKAHNLPILAGMWGGINSLLQNDAVLLRDDIVNKSRSMEKYKKLDQEILDNVIFYPRTKDIVAYDSYHCEDWKNFTIVRPFPVQRLDSVSDFVGNFDLGRKKYKALNKCPKECKPSYGKDWAYC